MPPGRVPEGHPRTDPGCADGIIALGCLTSASASSRGQIVELAVEKSIMFSLLDQIKLQMSLEETLKSEGLIENTIVSVEYFRVIESLVAGNIEPELSSTDQMDSAITASNQHTENVIGERELQ